MIVHEAAAVVIGLLVLAGVAFGIANGGNTAAVFKSAADGLATDIKAATLRG